MRSVASLSALLWEVEVGGSQVQGDSQLHSLPCSLGYMKTAKQVGEMATLAQNPGLVCSTHNL